MPINFLIDRSDNKVLLVEKSELAEWRLKWEVQPYYPNVLELLATIKGKHSALMDICERFKEYKHGNYEGSQWFEYKDRFKKYVDDIVEDLKYETCDLKPTSKYYWITNHKNLIEDNFKNHKTLKSLVMFLNKEVDMNFNASQMSKYINELRRDYRNYLDNIKEKEKNKKNKNESLRIWNPWIPNNPKTKEPYTIDELNVCLERITK